MCHYFRVSKVFVPHRVNSRFFVEFFVVSQCRKFPLGSPLVFYLFRVSRKIMDNRGGRGGREYQDFPSKICLTAPKNFVAEPFCAVFQKFSVSEKYYG